MISPRPSLTTSTVSSDEEITEDDVINTPPLWPSRDLRPPQFQFQPQSLPQATVNVGTIEMNPGAPMPGVLNGTLNKNTTTLNFLLHPANISDEIDPKDLSDFVTDAVKINSKTFESLHQSDLSSSSNKLTGTKEDVEGLSRRWCYLIAALVVLSLITLLGTAVLSVTSWKTSHGAPTVPPDTQASIDGLSAEEKHFAAVVGSPAIVGRIEWVAQPQRWTIGNTLPVGRVVVRDSMTEPCDTPATCVETVRTMQMVDIEQRHQPDILDNFLIGGDGRVYWGRGFASQNNYTQRLNNGSIGVAFIGDFAEDTPTETMVSAFKKLVGAGVTSGMISGNYTVVTRCQLPQGAAVGAALLQAVTTWSHYDHTAPTLCLSR